MTIYQLMEKVNNIKDKQELDNINCNSINCDSCPLSYENNGTSKWCDQLELIDLKKISKNYLEKF